MDWITQLGYSKFFFLIDAQFAIKTLDKAVSEDLVSTPMGHWPLLSLALNSALTLLAESHPSRDSWHNDRHRGVFYIDVLSVRRGCAWSVLLALVPLLLQYISHSGLV